MTEANNKIDTTQTIQAYSISAKKGPLNASLDRPGFISPSISARQQVLDTVDLRDGSQESAVEGTETFAK